MSIKLAGTSADGYIYLAGSDWDTVRNASDGSFVGASDSKTSGAMSVFSESQPYEMVRSFLFFDLSAIPPGTNISSAVISIGGYDQAVNNVVLQQGTQGDTLAKADFDAFTGDPLAPVLAWQVSTGPSDLNKFILNAAGRDYLRSAFGGTAKFCLREYDHDYSNVDPGSGYPDYLDGMYYAEQNDPDLSPHLEITLPASSFKVSGAGNNSSAQKVFRVTLSEASLDVPRLEAWDDIDLSSTSKEIFSGTSVNGFIPMLSGVATTDGVPSANWKPSSPVSGGAVINRLKGEDFYVLLSVSASATELLFNLCWEIPSDVSNEAGLEATIAVYLSFSWAPPTVTWYANDESEGGSESSPYWYELISAWQGSSDPVSILYPTDSGADSNNLKFSVPDTGSKDNPELWVVQ